MSDLQSLARQYLEEENYQQVVKIYEEIIENNSGEISDYFYLGLAYLLIDDIENAESVWMSILLNSDNFDDDLQFLLNILNNFAINQLQKNNLIQALKIYGKIHELLSQQIITKPDWGLYYYHFGLTLENLNDKNTAITAYEKAIEINKYLIDAYNNLGNIYSSLNQWEKAEFTYQEAIKINPQHSGSYFNLLLTLKNMGKFKEAIELVTKTAQLFPDDFTWQLQKYLFLPIIYHTEKEITYYRQRFTQGLNELINNLDISTENKKKNALEAIKNHTNFYLAYQGYNDLDLQQKYASLITQITHSNFPQWTKKRIYIKDKYKDKIKLGFVSGNSHNRAKWLFKWLENLDKNIFTIHVYFIDKISIDIEKNIQKIANFYCCIPDNLELICNKIYTDNLDVLTYTEIGMLPQTIVMGSLRLAFIQCSTIGHPLTSGLETIDYYISRDLMEIENSQSHYSEKLFLLPNIGICLEKEQIPPLTKSRQDFNLLDDDTIYLCSQMLFKYLPQYDYLFSEIAKQNPQAKFVFFESYPYLIDIFKHRLDSVFRDNNLDFQDYCLFLPFLCQNDYFNLNLLSDVFLDSITWSGDNTTREAIACHLPIVTYATEFMRGRHSYGILTMLGVTETIAFSPQEYIEIAVRLGNDKPYREEMREKIKANHHNLYNDLECVRALEKFYEGNYTERIRTKLNKS